MFCHAFAYICLWLLSLNANLILELLCLPRREKKSDKRKVSWLFCPYTKNILINDPYGNIFTILHILMSRGCDLFPAYWVEQKAVYLTFR